MEKLPCLLNQAALRFGKAPAVITEKQQISFLDFEGLVQGTAKVLAQKGIHKGDYVALIVPSGLEYLVFLFALFRLGSIPCLLNTRFPTQQINRLLNDLGIPFVVAPRDAIGKWRGTLLDAQALLQSHHAPNLTAVFYEKSQPATVVFTSGSMGDPKAALHSYGNHYFNAQGANENIPLALEDRWLLSLPLFHVGGLAIVFRTLLGGAAIVIPENPQAVAKNLKHHQITHTSLVNTQFRRLLQEPALKEMGPHLKGILLGGSAIAPDLLKKAHALGLPVFTSYGLTEMSSQITTTTAHASLEELKTSGRLLSHRRLKISEEGEVLTKGNTLFLGYVSHSKLHLPLDAEGWFHTGDRGYFKKEALVLLGRMDRMFISGGENIYPEEIERAFLELPEVEEIVVVPVEDETYGLRPVAFLKMQNQPLPTRSQARSKLQHVLPNYKIPDAYLLWPSEAETQGLKRSPEHFKQLAKQWMASK